mgnify:CR=1 FL=1
MHCTTLKRTYILFALFIACFSLTSIQVLSKVPLDSIVLSDPCILPDRSTMTYYMTGTGGKLWKSKDLRYWDGPYTVAETDPESWMGPKPMIWAAELHQYKGHSHQPGRKRGALQRKQPGTPGLPCVGQRQGRRPLPPDEGRDLPPGKQIDARRYVVGRHGRTALHGLLPRMAAKLGRHHRKNRIETRPKRQHLQRKAIV